MFYSIKKLVKNLEDTEKGCNFALAFGNEAIENLKILKQS